MAYNKVLDEYGLVNENEYITAFVPATKKAFIFRVLARINAGKEIVNYGTIPSSVTAATAMASPAATGGAAVGVNEPQATTTWAGDGTIGGMSFNTTSFSFPPPGDLSGAFDSTDMWYLKKQYRTTLFHTIMEVTPSWLQVECEIPKGVMQGRFQNDQGVQIGVGKTFGFSRGGVEMLHFPELHTGYRFGNDVNIDAYTSVKFTYAENRIAIPTDPDLIFSILTQQRQSHWITLPINTYDGSISNAFVGDYGFEGFPIFDSSQRETATSAYQKLTSKIIPEVAL
jgi:hypothetical protein